MIISDLNYLEAIATEADDVLGGSVYGRVDLKKRVEIYEKTRIDIKKKIKSDVDVKNNASYAEGLADAYGDNTFTEVFTATETTPYSSGSYGSSYGAVD